MMKSVKTLIPESVKQILEQLQDYPTAKPLAGGTDLLIKIKHKELDPDILISYNHLKRLNFIRENGNYIEIGPLTPFAELAQSKLLETYAPILRKAAEEMGSPLIRNIATIGGNIGNTSPVSDSVPSLFVYDGDIKLESTDGERWVTIDDFCVGVCKNCCEPTELITAIRFPKKDGDNIQFYKRLGQRKAMSISKVNVAFWAKNDGETLRNVRIAMGAVAIKVKYAKETMKFLEGKKLTETVIQEAADLIKSEAIPITDVRSSKEYRQEMLGALLSKGLRDVE